MRPYTHSHTLLRRVGRGRGGGIGGGAVVMVAVVASAMGLSASHAPPGHPTALGNCGGRWTNPQSPPPNNFFLAPECAPQNDQHDLPVILRPYILGPRPSPLHPPPPLGLQPLLLWGGGVASRHATSVCQGNWFSVVIRPISKATHHQNSVGMCCVQCVAQ